jgi:hypothetical protein
MTDASQSLGLDTGVADAAGSGDAAADGTGSPVDACIPMSTTAVCNAMGCGGPFADGCGGTIDCGPCCYAEPALDFGECGYNMTQPFAYVCSQGAAVPAGCSPAQTGYVCCPN